MILNRWHAGGGGGDLDNDLFYAMIVYAGTDLVLTV